MIIIAAKTLPSPGAKNCVKHHQKTHDKDNEQRPLRFGKRPFGPKVWDDNQHQRTKEQTYNPIEATTEGSRFN